MHKTGSVNGSFVGNFLYDRLLAGREHLLLDLKQRLVDFGFVRRACRVKLTLGRRPIGRPGPPEAW